MDETPMLFSLPSQTTAKEYSKRTISVLTMGHECTNFTITLACLADNTKLSLLIIFKLVNVPLEQFPDSVYVHANPSGWIDEKEMLWWMKNVWRRQANLGSNPRSLLVFDAFTAHRTDPCCSASTKINGSKDNLIFDFEKVSGIKSVRIGIKKKEGKNSEPVQKDVKSNPGSEYYEEEERMFKTS
ncbi:26643_t:CDS:2, partial [Dentiscutata erythropus]